MTGGRNCIEKLMKSYLENNREVEQLKRSHEKALRRKRQEPGMKDKLQELSRQHGTPLFILDHRKIRENYRIFKKNLPRVQCYYAVKANSHPEIIKTLFDEGSSFDVASYNEFMQIYEYIKHFEEKDKDFFIWDKIIFSNTIKDRETLRKIKRYRPLVTYDNRDELLKDQGAL